ncbi:MAG: polysaccharide deacetylase family protein [Verrucomicrobiae bacterium]|nr:polysaccharide deacetylase family protein [Verrucomicrobiae bacterium]MCP5541648.1 polysaccharide deacetylase family protein [Akkermansiaceae bacterium]MCP5549293.1 polysaccharide deacetylase family protein [Akkermansiaceae bacterium]
MPKPVASLSLDLDNQWAYMKTAGIAGWEEFPSYFDAVVPRILETFSALGIRATVFIVGQDAELEKNQGALASLVEAGHEVGNHSFHHEPWLPGRTGAQIEEEIARAEEAILAATGRRPRGWRGPSFVYSHSVYETLARRGYRYDASTFPTFVGPAARAYYFLKSGLNPRQRKDRSELFGTLKDGLRPLKPFRWDLGRGLELLEIPVTTMPFLRTPIHLSYLLYLAALAPAVARGYFKAALALCRMTGVEPSLLLHPLDFLGGDDVPELAFFPAMNRDGAWKTARTREFLEMLVRDFRPVTMEEHATLARGVSAAGLPVLALAGTPTR